MAYPKARLAVPARNPQPGVEIDKTLIIKYLHQFNGNISRVADKIGCNRCSIQRWVNKDKDVAQALSESRERINDALEDVAAEKALAGDGYMTTFLLKTRCRSRGYSFDESNNNVKDMATAAFEFVVNRSKNPAET